MRTHPHITVINQWCINKSKQNQTAHSGTKQVFTHTHKALPLLAYLFVQGVTS